MKKMNKEEFLKEHPSLALRHIDFPDDYLKINTIFCKPENIVFDMEMIHETQIDKQKVKDAIDKVFPPRTEPEYKIMLAHNLSLKQELGLE